MTRETKRDPDKTPAPESVHQQKLWEFLEANPGITVGFRYQFVTDNWIVEATIRDPARPLEREMQLRIITDRNRDEAVRLLLKGLNA